MQLTFLKWKNWLEKVHRINTKFTKMVHRILNFLMQNSDNPNIVYVFDSL